MHCSRSTCIFSPWVKICLRVSHIIFYARHDLHFVALVYVYNVVMFVLSNIFSMIEASIHSSYHFVLILENISTVLIITLRSTNMFLYDLSVLPRFDPNKMYLQDRTFHSFDPYKMYLQDRTFHIYAKCFAMCASLLNTFHFCIFRIFISEMIQVWGQRPPNPNSRLGGCIKVSRLK